MDLVKLKGRSTKVKCGDRVSVPGDYFGKSFQKSIASLGVQDNRLYGYVVDVYAKSRKFSI